MRRALLLLWSALTAGVESTFQVTTNTLPTTSSSSNNSRLIPVLVGGSSLAFTPNSVTARPGDVIQFQFAARNHSVTQSLEASPCQPVDAAGDGSVNGVHSGFIVFDDAAGAGTMVGTFDVPVRDTEPMFLYCAQATHCQSGMVMVINGDSNALIQYANTASTAPSNTPAKVVSGGVVAAIPIADSVLANSSLTASPPSPASITTTVTNGGGGGGGIATATVTAAGSVIGGGTATAFATVVVGPSGVSAGNNATAARVTGGLLSNGTGAAAAKASPQVVTAGAAAGGRRVAGSVFVAAGAMALGATVLLGVRR